jgi:hypothetical protein
MQAAILWSLGRECCGFVPKNALKSLFLQAEDDDGDLIEMRDGVIKGTGLTPAEADQAKANVLICTEQGRTGGAFCLYVLGPSLQDHRPDIVWVNPALAYLGGDTSNQDVVSRFLRNQVNPLLTEFQCGGVIIAHPAKPPRDKAQNGWAPADYAYAALGSVEWANWARAIIVLRGTKVPGAFELLVPKRGKRLRWKDPGSTPTEMKIILQSPDPDVMFWREGGEYDSVSTGSGKVQHTADDLLAYVPAKEPIAKARLLCQAQAIGIGQNRARQLIAELIEGGNLYEWFRKRPGTNAERFLAREPQPEGWTGPERANAA